MGLKDPVIGIVGGSGGMGRWLADLFRNRGFSIMTAGRNSDLTPAGMAGQCDVVAVSVPIPVTEKVIADIGPRVRKEGLLMDLTSVKKAPLDAMLKNSCCQVVGLHPLFGPESSGKKGLKIAVCPGRGEEGLKWITGILEKEGYNITGIDAETHDRIMGIIQGVNHFSTLALAMTIRDSEFDLKDFERLSTADFDGRLGRIKEMLGQPGDLFEAIFMENRAIDVSLESYIGYAEKIRKIIKERNSLEFKDIYNSLKIFFE